MIGRIKRNHVIGALALAAVVACSNETTSQQVLGAVPAANADAQTMQQAKPTKVGGPAKPLPKGAYQLQLVTIPDPTGRMQSPVSARALVPAGWTTQGGTIWPAEAAMECAPQATYAWSATAPDGKSSFQIFPAQVWQASNTNQLPCTYGEFQDMRSYLQAYVQQNVQGAGNFQYRPRPDLLEPQRADIDFYTQLMATTGTTRFWADGGELAFTYTDGGTPMKGVIGATARFFLTQLANPLGGPPISSLTGETNYTYAASFPTASFDPQLVEAMRKSVKPDSTWLYNYSEFTLRLAEQKTGIVKQRADAIVAAGYALTRATIERNRAAGAAAVAAAKNYADVPASSGATAGGSDDRSQRERIESIRGVETYDDPVYGGTVQLDNTYDHAWRVNNNDSYILTNDPNFNPGLYNIDAQQLKVTR